MNGDDDTSDGKPASRRRVLAATGAAGAGLLAGCLGSNDPGAGPSDGSDSDGGAGSDGDTATATPDSMGNTPAEPRDSMDDGSAGISWRTMDLTTVRGEETFTIEGFEKPVVLETFAVWCPICKRQQQQLTKLGDAVVVVSLNTDPNEDAAKVRKHAEENGFDWRFAVAPSEMTGALIDEFGPTVTNAPSTPVIVVCPGGSAEFRSGNVLSSQEILSAAGNC